MPYRRKTFSITYAIKNIRLPNRISSVNSETGNKHLGRMMPRSDKVGGGVPDHAIPDVLDVMVQNFNLVGALLVDWIAIVIDAIPTAGNVPRTIGNVTPQGSNKAIVLCI